MALYAGTGVSVITAIGPAADVISDLIVTPSAPAT
jgi:hypothetical protein